MKQILFLVAFGFLFLFGFPCQASAQAQPVLQQEIKVYLEGNLDRISANVLYDFFSFNAEEARKVGAKQIFVPVLRREDAHLIVKFNIQLDLMEQRSVTDWNQVARNRQLADARVAGDQAISLAQSQASRIRIFGPLLGSLARTTLGGSIEQRTTLQQRNPNVLVSRYRVRCEMLVTHLASGQILADSVVSDDYTVQRQFMTQLQGGFAINLLVGGDLSDFPQLAGNLGDRYQGVFSVAQALRGWKSLKPRN
jgi:hypothetical protein